MIGHTANALSLCETRRKSVTSKARKRMIPLLRSNEASSGGRSKYNSPACNGLEAGIYLEPVGSFCWTYSSSCQLRKIFNTIPGLYWLQSRNNFHSSNQLIRDNRKLRVSNTWSTKSRPLKSAMFRGSRVLPHTNRRKRDRSLGEKVSSISQNHWTSGELYSTPD